jgi:hypothetical protein
MIDVKLVGSTWRQERFRHQSMYVALVVTRKSDLFITCMLADKRAQHRCWQVSKAAVRAAIDPPRCGENSAVIAHKIPIAPSDRKPQFTV